MEGATSYNLYWNTAGNVTKRDHKISNVISPYVLSAPGDIGVFVIVTAQNAKGEGPVSQQGSNVANVNAYISIPQNSVGFHDYPGARANGVFVSGSTLYVADAAGARYQPGWREQFCNADHGKRAGR